MYHPTHLYHPRRRHMEFQKVIETRRTTRHFTDQLVEKEQIQRILETGVLAPSHNHLRQWDFVILMDKAAKDAAIAPIQPVPFDVEKPKNPMQVMCKLAFPRQHQMLKEAPCILLPIIKNNGALFHAKEVFGMMDFASIWCVIENIFLAATNEGLACTMHMPHGDEHDEIMSSIHCPKGYILPCVIGIGYAADDAEYPPQVNFDFEDGIHWNKW